MKTWKEFLNESHTNPSVLTQKELTKFWKGEWVNFWDELDRVKDDLKIYRSLTNLPDTVSASDLSKLSNKLKAVTSKLKDIR